MEGASGAPPGSHGTLKIRGPSWDTPKSSCLLGQCDRHKAKGPINATGLLWQQGKQLCYRAFICQLLAPGLWVFGLCAGGEEDSLRKVDKDREPLKETE